jgi:hypothetical protein
MSVANDIAMSVADRIGGITKANGFATDIGLKVMRGRRRLDEKSLPCSVIVEREDKVLDNRPGQVKLAQPIIIEGHAACDADNPNDVGHQIIADIKKAVFASKLTYGTDQRVIIVNYVGRSIAPREDGVAVVSAAVEVSVEFVENLAAP